MHGDFSAAANLGDDVLRKAIIAAVLAMGLIPTSAAAEDGHHRDRHVDQQKHFTALTYGSQDWTYVNVASGAFAAFPASSPANEASVSTQAGFGTSGRGCRFGDPRQPTTTWKPGTDLLLRHDIGLSGLDPTHGTNDRIEFTGTLKGSADIYYDGDFVKHVEATSCQRSNVSFSVDPDGDEFFGELEIRAMSAAADDSNYVDIKAVVYYTRYGCEDC